MTDTQPQPKLSKLFAECRVTMAPRMGQICAEYLLYACVRKQSNIELMSFYVRDNRAEFGVQVNANRAGLIDYMITRLAEWTNLDITQVEWPMYCLTVANSPANRPLASAAKFRDTSLPPIADVFVDEYAAIAREYFRKHVAEEMMARMWHPRNQKRFRDWGEDV